MKKVISILFVTLIFSGCARPASKTSRTDADKPNLEIVAESQHQWTGVAVTTTGRVFVNFPRWSSEVPLSVAEVLPDGSLRPFPDERWNSWTPNADPATTFVCVQSVVADGQGSLWVLDPANPGFGGVVPGGPKLVEIDVPSGAIVQVIGFDETVAPPASYLNDVRVDLWNRAAYITDSGSGALVVVDLSTGSGRRLLANHPSTHAENTVLTIEGRDWLLPDGSAPRVDADGIAFDPDQDIVFFQALTGRTLYRVSGKALRDPTLTEEDLASSVEAVAQSGPADGLLWDGADGVFLSSLEDDAVKRWSPGAGVTTVIADPRIAWPDSFALGPDGALYLTTSQIHRGPNPPEPYRILRITGF